MENAINALIIEDDSSSVALLKEFLKDFSYINILGEASNIKDAELLIKNTPKVDLVFMDIKMPIMDGFQAFMSIHSFKPDLPIIAQTAHSSNEDQEKIMQMGFTDYITKPLDKERVFEILNTVFNSNK